MQTLTPGSILGHAVRRREDPRLITGAGRFVDDIQPDRCLHAAFVRSTLAHATIRAVDVAAAAAAPGVVAVLTAADLGLPARVGFHTVPEVFARPPLAEGRVRFVGEPVALVIAESPQAAVDAAQLVGLDLEPLEVVVDAESARQAGSTLLFPAHGSNVANHIAPRGDVDVLAGAEVTIQGRFVNQRLAPVPMEPEAILVVPEAGRLTVWATSQTPFGLRAAIASSLGIADADIRVVVGDMGGGFGAKAGARPELIVVAAAARKLGRPVKWIETRSENLVGMTHGRGQVQHVELGATRDGRLIGLRARVVADVGAYPGIAALLPFLTGQMAAGVYAIPAIDYEAHCVVTNTTPLGAYRGAGRPEAAAMVERAMDMLAVELGIDPAELRRCNLIAPDRFPYTTAGGATYDSGEYERALDKLLEISAYPELRAEQARRRERGDRLQLGIGLSVYVEVTAVGIGPEWGAVRIEADGTATVRCGTTSFGQGHETSLAQIAAEQLGLPLDSVLVIHSDTDVVERGTGTVGSRSMQHGGSAVHQAALKVRHKARDLASHLLEASPEDIVFVAGTVGVAGVPERSFSWASLAAAAAGDRENLPEGMEPGLSAEADFAGDGSYPFGAHCAVVEVDLETGDARLVRFFAVDDCGRIINPLLAEGQVHGGIAQGVGQALLEEVVFDDQGTPRTASLLDYLIPSIGEIPEVVTATTETPSPNNPLGAKGVGESGTIGSTPAVQNAVVDALSHLGIRHIDMPLKPERVWAALAAAARADAITSRP
ncbi:MAG TPA: xanthine dehydrogenase family protein molybdopterin-binding subunit [Candidatus Dormibacteraeota bacterium]|nr:xanthine dehydrogenase family protein molybdopterin-binding subunit [Candidatus Dormibacteraeota bacterium]